MATGIGGALGSEKDLAPLRLPDGITEKYVDCRKSCDLKWHVLEAGDRGKPLVLFCHGFPELAYSWRKVMPRIAAAGYYCVAMDQRGYGRTTGWAGPPFFEADSHDFVFTNLIRDLVCLVYALGYPEVFSIVGHDFGAVSSAMAALMRPDMFKSTVQMSHPFHGPPTPRHVYEQGKAMLDLQDDLEKLHPPRKHYKYYNASPPAASHWDCPGQGMEKFLRGYFHLKSADWHKNNPKPLKKWTARALADMPEYYIMQKRHSMPESVEYNMLGEDYAKTERWLPQEDLQVYRDEWQRTGFHGALSWYRAQIATTPKSARDMLLFSGRKIEVPITFISGKQDWGNFQQPGALESYEDPDVIKPGCYRAMTLIEGAGHWVQQEQPDAVVDALLRFFDTL
ncbi:alpha/beta-hydrolase [Poronia punctata]|nr:alpha/beta-hydrolase [Poronia punctata]